MNYIADRVKETTATSGTGNLTLLGAAAQFQAFFTAFGITRNFYYTITDGDLVDWECGEGTLTSSATMVRSYVTASSNAGALVSLSANTHTVFCSLTAQALRDEAGYQYMQSRSMYVP